MPNFIKTLGLIKLKLSTLILVFLTSCNSADNSEFNYSYISEKKNSELDSIQIQLIENCNNQFDISFGSNPDQINNYCGNTNRVTSAGILRTEESIEPGFYPSITSIIDSTEFDYNEIETLIDFQQFMNLEDPHITMNHEDPDPCWIEISKENLTRKLNYYCGEEPVEIKPLLDLLYSIVEN